MSDVQMSTTGAELVIRTLKRWGGRAAFSGYGGSYSYRAAYDLLGRYQAVLQAAGCRPGERMAQLHANRGDAWLATVAAQGLGLCVTALHPLGSLEDHQFILDDAGIDYLLVDVDNYLERGAALSAGREELRQCFTLGAADYGLDLNAGAAAAGAVTPVAVGGAGDQTLLAYTGGTTGKSKGVLRDNRSAMAVSRSIMADFEWPQEVTYLAVAPISHVGGTKITPALVRGGRIHFQHGFDPDAVLEAIARERISVALLVPTMVYILLDHPALAATDLSSLELLMYGASPMSPSRLLEGLERIGPVFCQLYGQTEGYPISVLHRRDHDPANPARFASCGYPCSNVTAALLDADDQPVSPGETGEICVRAPQVMLGYWRRPEETAATLANGWLHTGDMARADEEDYLYIVDRKKDMIISGGFNLFPKEVEDVLSADPGVAVAAVIGVPDEKWGEAVKAVVVPRDGMIVEPAALIERVRSQKGAVYAPKSVEIVKEIPLTAIGKPDKKALRESYWQDKTRRVG